jgi:hypothetical protein
MTLLDGLLPGGGSSSLRASLITLLSCTLGIRFMVGNGNNLFTCVNFEEEEKMVVSSTTKTSFGISIFFCGNRTEVLVSPCFDINNYDV